MNLSKKNKYYIAGLLSTLVLIIGIIFIGKYNSPIEKFKREIEKSDYVSAVSLYDAQLASSDDSWKAVAFMRSELNVILQEFKEGMRDYQSVTAELDAFSQIEDVSVYVDDIRSDINYYQGSYNAYATAEEFFGKKDFGNAIMWYRQVVADDKNFPDAQQKIETSVASYRDMVVKKVDALAAEEKYADANTVLTEAFGIIPDDTILSQKWNSILAEQEKFLLQQELVDIDQLLNEKKFEEALKKAVGLLECYGGNAQIEGKYKEAVDAYEKDITAQVDQLLAEKNLDGAQGKINELSVLLPESVVFYELSDRIKKYYPVKLSDLKVTEKRVLRKEVVDFPKDPRGNTYNWGLEYPDPYVWADTAWEIYLLNKEYKRFTAVIVPSEDMVTGSNSAVFKIYTDNGSGEREVFSTEVDIYSEPKPIKIDLTGVDRLRIEFDGGYNARYLLAEPELTKEIME